MVVIISIVCLTIQGPTRPTTMNMTVSGDLITRGDKVLCCLHPLVDCTIHIVDALTLE